VGTVKLNERARGVEGSAPAQESCRTQVGRKSRHGVGSPDKGRRYAVIRGSLLHCSIVALNERPSVQAIGVALGIKDPVTGPDHGFVIKSISQPDARAEVPIVRVD